MANAPAAAPRGPDFLCIGVTKGGTSWLYGNLPDHPAIWLPPIKELRYFNTIHLEGPHQQTDVAHRAQLIEARRARLLAGGEALSPRRQRLLACLDAMADGPQSDDWYGRIFTFRGPRQLAGDISPQYAVLPEAGIRHALALNPALKVIALLREPAARTLSHIAMHLGPEATVEQVLQVARSPRWPAYARHSDYATWLSRWRDALPPGALHIDTMGRIGREPLAVLEGVCGFLGVPAPPGTFARAAERVNAGRGDRNRLAAALPALRAALAPAYAALQAEWPDLARRLAEEE
jgi:hypothetical protein